MSIDTYRHAYREYTNKVCKSFAYLISRNDRTIIWPIGRFAGGNWVTEETRYAFQFIRVSSIPSNSFLTLLVCVPWATLSKSTDCCSKLCVLWLVGLAFPAFDSSHVFV